MVMFDDPDLRLTAESPAISTEQKVKVIAGALGKHIGSTDASPSSADGVGLCRALGLFLNCRLLVFFHRIHNALTYRKRRRVIDRSAPDPTP